LVSFRFITTKLLRKEADGVPYERHKLIICTDIPSTTNFKKCYII